MSKTPKIPKIGDRRWRLEHISYKAWCDKARSRGWNGNGDADGLREYCEPEEAAMIIDYPSLEVALAAAHEIFKAAPDDSAFGAILVKHQIVEAAHDDGGNLISGCKPEWEVQKIYEITADGDVQDIDKSYHE